MKYSSNLFHFWCGDSTNWTLLAHQSTTFNIKSPPPKWGLKTERANFYLSIDKSYEAETHTTDSPHQMEHNHVPISKIGQSPPFPKSSLLSTFVHAKFHAKKP